MSKDKLAYALQIRYGTGEGEPNSSQIDQIIQYVVRMGGTNPTFRHWGEAVQKYCPTTGRYRYDGIDNSDINALLTMAMKK